jgi:PLD-like domain
MCWRPTGKKTPTSARRYYGAGAAERTRQICGHRDTETRAKEQRCLDGPRQTCPSLSAWDSSRCVGSCLPGPSWQPRCPPPVWPCTSPPRGGATAAVVQEVHGAQQHILVQAYSCTSAPIAKARIEAHKRGVNILAVLDKSNETKRYSAATFVVNAGIQTLIDAQHAIAHRKVMVLDHATVITGSFNFTKAAEENNAENLVVITDAPELVQAYEANGQAHAAHAHPYARRSAAASSSTPPMVQASGDVHGNRNSKVYRVPGCKGYASMRPASVVPFTTETEAQQAGYRKAKDCS